MLNDIVDFIKKNIDPDLKENYHRLIFAAEKTLKETSFRNDVFFYIIGALEYYKNKKKMKLKKLYLK